MYWCMSDDGTREVKFNQKHYDLLMKCAEKGDMTEWNEWYRPYQQKRNTLSADPGAYLEGAYLGDLNLFEVDLSNAHLERTNLSNAKLCMVNLSAAHLDGSNLSMVTLTGSNLTAAHLDDAVLISADLEETILDNCCFNKSTMTDSHFQNAKMRNVKMLDANLSGSHFEGVDMKYGDLKGADLVNAYLEGTDLSNSDLRAANFECSCLDGKTTLMRCKHNDKTDFTATSIASTRIEPDTLTALQKNIRRKHWIKWYDQHVNLQGPVRLFWWLSDYGTTCKRCVGAFTLLIAVAFLTYFWITGFVIPDIPQLLADTILATFGFGGLYDQLIGPSRLLLAAHVLAGYFLLAVLITRFAVMFQSLTP